MAELEVKIWPGIEQINGLVFHYFVLLQDILQAFSRFFGDFCLRVDFVLESDNIFPKFRQIRRSKLFFFSLPGVDLLYILFRVLYAAEFESEVCVPVALVEILGEVSHAAV